MKKYSIDLPADVVLYIQKLHLEDNALSNIVSKVLTKDINASDKKFEKLFQDYKRNNFEYTIAKESITNIFVPDKLKSHNISWQINFDNSKLEITQHCSCEVTL